MVAARDYSFEEICELAGRIQMDCVELGIDTSKVKLKVSRDEFSRVFVALGAEGLCGMGLKVVEDGRA